MRQFRIIINSQAKSHFKCKGCVSWWNVLIIVLLRGSRLVVGQLY